MFGQNEEGPFLGKSLANYVLTKLLLLFFTFLLASAPAHAQWLGCEMGFLTGTSVGIDPGTGKLDLRDAAWSDASIIQSGSPSSPGSPCISPLMDWLAPNQPVESNLVNKQVTIYTKRDANALYFRFVVNDSTANELIPNPGEPLPNGEKIVIQLDPQNLRGAQLPNPGDFRLDIVHKWDPGTVTTTFYNSTNSGSICGKEDWLQTSTPTDIQVALDVDGKTQYTVGAKIPFDAIGNTVASKFGLGIIIVNDLGFCDSSGQVCKATATSFPFDPVNLPVTNSTPTSAPTDPVGCGNWLVPSFWGGGTFSPISGGITILQTPYPWLSDAITVLACGTTPNYQYYPDPCTLKIQAVLDNSTGSAQLRNILFLWGDYGTGQFKWRFVDLQQHASIGAPQGTVTSILWTSVPKNLPEHPCVRVYILPDTLLARFSATDMQTKFDTPGFTAADLEATYSLGPPQFAQKNISVATTGTICPGCAEARRLPPVDSGTQASRGLQASILPVRRFGMMSLFTNLAALQVTSTSVPSRGQGKSVSWPAESRERFEKEDVAVQVRAVCSTNAPASNKTPRYDFLEDCGGLLKLVPASLLEKGRGVPLTFNISNSAKVPRIISLNVTTFFPPGVKPVPISIDTKPHLLQPGETRTIRGNVGRRCFLFPTGMTLPLLFTAALFALGLVSYRRRGAALYRP